MNSYKKAYENLYSSVYENSANFPESNTANFVAMKGTRFDANQIKLLLVGRATNGWDRGLRKTDKETFSKTAAELFAKTDRFHTEWSLRDFDTNPYSEYIDKEGAPKKYFISRSDFWGSTKEVWCKLNNVIDKPNWLDDIAWSNIFKVAPMAEGNPSNSLIRAQAAACVEILKEEVNILKPTHILMEIDESWLSWAPRGKEVYNFMNIFENITDRSDIIPKGQKIVQKAFTSKGTKVIVSCRPERLSREIFSQTIAEAFSKM